MLLERKDEQTARCPFCHDGLEAARLVECDSCRAVYHAECVERCVVLGCQGTLAGAEGAREATPRRAVLRVDVQPRPAVAEAPAPRSPRVAAMVRLAFLACFAGFVGFLAVGALTDARSLVLPSFGCLVACVALAQAETAGPPSAARLREREARDERRRQREAADDLRLAARSAARDAARDAARPRLTPVEPAPDAPLAPGPPLPPPPPVAFPTMFGPPPDRTDGAPGGVVDEALRRIAARREARRPGGLGKTL